MDIEIWKYYKCQVLRKIVCKVIYLVSLISTSMDIKTMCQSFVSPQTIKIMIYVENELTTYLI